MRPAGEIGASAAGAARPASLGVGPCTKTHKLAAATKKV